MVSDHRDGDGKCLSFCVFGLEGREEANFRDLVWIILYF